MLLTAYGIKIKCMGLHAAVFVQASKQVHVYMHCVGIQSRIDT